MKGIIDPVYDYVPLEDHECDLINQPFIQRLKHIKQLGVAFYVYPAATHTRFEHCVGTMHVASRIYDVITNERLQCKDLEANEKKVTRKLVERLHDNKFRYLTRICALFHDLGHGPFSHTIEDLFRRSPEYRISKNDLLDLVGELKNFQQKNPELWNGDFIPQTLMNHEHFTQLSLMINKEKIEETLKQSIPDDETRPTFTQLLEVLSGKTKDMETKVISRIITGDLDADRIDYLLRDTHHVGFRHSSVDLNNIVNEIRLFRIFMNGKPEWFLSITPKGVLATEALLITRKYHYDRIVTNPDQRLHELHFLRTVEKCLGRVKAKAKGKIISMFLDSTDEHLMAFVEEEEKKPFHKIMSETKDYECYDMRWGQFLPNIIYDLLTIWRNGEFRKKFEELFEYRLRHMFEVEDVIVDLCFHDKLPAFLLISTSPGFKFLYDYSLFIGDFPEVLLQDGAIRIYLKDKTVMTRLEKMIFGRKKEDRPIYEEILEKELLKLSENVRSQYLHPDPAPELQRTRDLDQLYLLLTAISKLLDDVTFLEEVKSDLTNEFGEEKETAINDAIKRRKKSLGIRTSIYSYVFNLRNEFSFKNRIKEIENVDFKSYNFYYSSEMYEDLQRLRATGLLFERRVPSRKPIKKGIEWHVPVFYYYPNTKYQRSFLRKRPTLNKQLGFIEKELKAFFRKQMCNEVKRMTVLKN